MTVELPNNVSDTYYEIAVSKFIRALGYFTENNIFLNENGTQLLEIDTVATPSNDDFTSRILIESKSGKTGFPDLFKIYGQKTFINIEKACLIRKNNIPEEDKVVFSKYLKKLNLGLAQINFDEGKKEIDSIKEYLPFIANYDGERFVDIFYLSYWQGLAENVAKVEYKKIKRECFEKAKKGLEIDLTVFSSISDYENTCMLSFFERNPIERVLALYDAYKNNPQLTVKAMNFEEFLTGKTHNKIFNALDSSKEHLWVQYVSLLEHRARILIIKTAIDVFYMMDKTKESQDDVWINSMLFNLVPSSFENGYDFIAKLPFRNKLPFFFEIFIEVFGGFVCEKGIYGGEEISLLCKLTGIEEKDFQTCLDVYNTFFPISNKWVYSSNGLILLKFVPALFRGIGAFSRATFFEEGHYKSYSKINWLLGVWNDAVVDILGLDENLKKN